MAYAMHTNTDYAYGADVPLLLGQFTEKEHGHYFEYADRPFGLGGDFAPDATHVVYVGYGGQYRFARVLKTVVYVATDEEITAVWEKWSIKQHRHYLTQWAIDARDDVIQKGQAA